jgi:hypothetical protein
MQIFSGQVVGGGVTLLLRRGTMVKLGLVTDWILESMLSTSLAVYKSNHALQIIRLTP